MLENSLVVPKKKSLIEILIDAILPIICIVSFIIFLICATIIIKKNLFPDKVPDIFGIKPFIVLSGSMEPNIMVGDLIIMKEVDVNTLKDGDIVAFRNTEENTVIVHRIVSIEKNGENNVNFYTKGDANDAQDSNAVSKDIIEGIYFYRIPKLGTIAMFIRSKEGIIISILFVFAIFLIWQIAKNRRKGRIIKRRYKEAQEYIAELKSNKLIS